jgi:transposase
MEYRKTVQFFSGFMPQQFNYRRQDLTASHPQGSQPAADTLPLSAQSLTHSKSALGAKYRRLRARLAAPKAIVAMAPHLAPLVYRMFRYGENYVEKGIEHYEQKFPLQCIKWLREEARLLNFQLVLAQ